MSDITVTINPPNSTSVTIGNVVYPHGATHAAGGSDSLSGYYYPSNNPSGYVTSGDFATTGYVADVSGAIVAQISFPQNIVFTTGDQNISGAKNFYSRPTVNGTGVLLSGEASAQSTGYLTGYVSKLESGAFYPISNPSGYITGVDLGSYATISYATGISGYLQSEINSINLLPLETATGVLNSRVTSLESNTGNYYLASNPSGFITGGDLSSYATTSYVTGVSGYLNGKITTLQSATGDLNNRSIKTIFVSGTSTKTITLVRGDDSTTSTTFIDISGDFSGASGYLQGQISTLNSQTGSYVTGSIIRPSDTGAFYPVSNPSGYITDVDLSSYASISYVTGVSGFLQSEISALQSSTGSYITGSVVRPNETGQFLTGETDPIFTSSAAFGINSTLSGNWTTAYSENITGINVAGSTTKTITLYQRDGGNISASFTDSEGTGAGADFYIYSGSFDSGNGNLTLNRTGDNGTVVIPLDGRYSTVSATTGISGYLQGQISAINLAPLQSATGNLNTRVTSLESQTGNYVTGSVIRPFDTGAFYPTTNPSGFVTGVDLSNYAAIPNLTGASGYLQNQISSLNGQTGSYITGSVVRPSDTGNFIINSQTGLFYADSNPSGFITGIDLSNHQTIVASTGISGFLQSEIDSLNNATGNLNTRVSAVETQTGNFVLKSATGAFLTTGAADARFYPLSSNPFSYLVAADISNLASTGYVTGVSGYLQNGINTLNSATGFLYPRNNPSGYITGVDLSAYALQSSINSINSQSGQWITGYTKSLTGLSFVGTDTKTLTLYSQDGTTLSANFSDIQGTGGAITGYISLVGDENISGVKNFYSRPTVNGSGVVLSGEIYPTIREVYIDAGAMLTGVSGATPSTVSVSNSGIAYDGFSFDSAVTGYTQFKLKLGDYNLGGIRAKFDWTTSGTGGGVVWGIQGVSVNDSGLISSSWGASQEVSDSFITGTGLHQTSGTSTITLGGSPQVNSMLCFQIYRNVYHASDTLAVNASLLGIKLQYTGVSIQAW